MVSCGGHRSSLRCLRMRSSASTDIGVEIEDPFGHDPNDLPAERIGETIALSMAEVTSASAP